MNGTAGRGWASLPGTVHPTKGRRKHFCIEISEKVFRCTFSYPSGDLAGWCKFRCTNLGTLRMVLSQAIGEVSLSYPQSELYFIASAYNGWFDWLLRQSNLFERGGERKWDKRIVCSLPVYGCSVKRQSIPTVDLLSGRRSDTSSWLLRANSHHADYRQTCQRPSL